MCKIKKPTISLCMIVKNGEEFLARCLQSVAGVVDEIVVVDTGSTDSTIEIAHRFKGQVFQHRWKEDFSEARNRALAHATSEWILILDADEVLDEESATRLTEVVTRTRVFGFFFCIYNIKKNGFVAGRHYAVRLFRNQRGVRFVGNVHEQVVPMGTLAGSDMRISHYGYDLDPDTMKEKNRRNRHLLEKSLMMRKRDPVVRYHLANICLLSGDYEQAIEHATRGIELTGENSALYLTTVHVLAEIYFHQGEWNEAERWCKTALRRRDDFIDALYTLARTYRLQKNYRKALTCYHQFLEKKKLVEGDPQRGLFFRSLSSWGREADVYNDLAGIFYECGNPDRAVELVKKAIEYMPDGARGYCNLGLALAARGQFGHAGESFKKALERKPLYPEAEEGLKRVKAFLSH